MDLPLIAQIDLPIDAAGSFRMAIAIDGKVIDEYQFESAAK